MVAEGGWDEEPRTCQSASGCFHSKERPTSGDAHVIQVCWHLEKPTACLVLGGLQY